MPRTCSVCTHPERAQIDRALLSGEATARIAARVGGVSNSALKRHKARDLAAVLLRAQKAKEARREKAVVDFAEAKEVREIRHGEDLFAQVQDLTARTMRILDQAESSRDPRTALSAIREVRGRYCQLEAKSPVFETRSSNSRTVN